MSETVSTSCIPSLRLFVKTIGRHSKVIAFYGAEVLFGALSFLCEPLFIGCEAYEWVLVDPCVLRSTVDCSNQDSICFALTLAAG